MGKDRVKTMPNRALPVPYARPGFTLYRPDLPVTSPRVRLDQQTGENLANE